MNARVDHIERKAGLVTALQQHARFLSLLASSGFAVVFIALIVSAFWAAGTIERATERAETAGAMSEAYAKLTRELWSESALVRDHGTDASGSGMYELRAIAIALEATAATIAANAMPDDRVLVRNVLADHDRYVDSLMTLFSSIDNEESAPLQLVKRRRSGELFAAIQARIDARDLKYRELARQAIVDLRTAETSAARTIVLVSIIGVLELFGCSLFVGASRRKAEQAKSRQLVVLERTSRTDNLTGLGNHRAYQETLERLLQAAQTQGRCVSLVLIDVDNFKIVNDRMGHVHGDRVLAALGAWLREFGCGELGFRLGGDEFAVIFPAGDGVAAAARFERMQSAAARRMYGVTVSMGIGCNAGDATLSATLLRARADAALYAAKAAGRNRLVTYDPAMHEASVVTPQKIAAVHALISDAALDISFQPIWDLATSRPFGYEALSRPRSESGLSGPDEAFSIAESLGRAHELDAVCVRLIIAAAASLPPSALLFLNIAPKSFHAQWIAGTAFADTVRDAGLAPERIVLELPERAMPRMDGVLCEAKRLQSLGFKLALDNTGSGNAALEILQQIRFDYIKIDRRTMVQAVDDPTRAAIVKAIVLIAQAMNAYVIAEGIDTSGLLEYATSDAVQLLQSGIAVSGVQGYLFMHPAPAPWVDLERLPQLLQQGEDLHAPVAS